MGRAMMQQLSLKRRTAMPRNERPQGLAAYAMILGLGALLLWLSRRHPALMPAWAPWDFSPCEYLATALTLLWFWRGLALAPAAARPSAARCLAFLLGMLALYAVLQTRFEYWSQHMFFLNRIQHVVMHHIGPFLIALGGVGETVKRGMPARLRRAAEHRAAAGVIAALQQPALAAFLFVGSFYFWLIPSVHFRAMIDPRLYALMNWTMVLDGVLFWSLVLDMRPQPPARVSFAGRVLLAVAVMFPQIGLGALITFSRQDLYPYYDLCGRLYPSISALNDQHIGGIVIWIPPAMMSVIAVLIVLNALRFHEDSMTESDHDAAALATLASRWTGR
jgi:putative membrane protein